MDPCTATSSAAIHLLGPQATTEWAGTGTGTGTSTSGAIHAGASIWAGDDAAFPNGKRWRNVGLRSRQPFDLLAAVSSLGMQYSNEVEIEYISLGGSTPQVLSSSGYVPWQCRAIAART